MADVEQQTEQRPHHRRNASSKSSIFRSLVSPRGRSAHPEPTNEQVRLNESPTRSSRVLGERQGNVQSPPSSPSKKTKVPTKTNDGKGTQSKSKSSSSSSTNLAGIFSRINRSSKDLSVQVKDKENSTPPQSATTRPNAPIWAQFSSADDVKPAKAARPKSAYFGNGEYGRRNIGDKSDSCEPRRSEDIGQRVNRQSVEHEKVSSRKTSGGSTEVTAGQDNLNVAKRSGRVMAAVAALQSKTKDVDAPLDPQVVDTQFEAVLDARNIPEPMRQKMRSLTLRVKADFVKQDQGASKTTDSSPSAPLGGMEQPTTVQEATVTTKVDTKNDEENDKKAGKRSRSRSRVFTFSRGRKEDKGEASPSKKQRSQSRGRPHSIIIPDDTSIKSDKTPTTPTGFGSFGRKSQPPALPADYISYLQKNQKPAEVEVGRLHKLRILLRNETVAWVDAFIGQGGMLEIIGLLKRTMALEWREDHEDQLMHETLLCLKGICTTERAMAELNKFADDLSPELLGMLFDEEKKGPAEYSTRTIIINVLCKLCSIIPSLNGANKQQSTISPLRPRTHHITSNCELGQSSSTLLSLLPRSTIHVRSQLILCSACELLDHTRSGLVKSPM